MPTAEQVRSYNGQRSNAPGSPQNHQNLERSLHMDPDGSNAVQHLQEEDPLDMQEVSKLSFSLERFSWNMLYTETLSVSGSP